MSASYAETAAEIAVVENPVDELRELIAESDRLLWVLETLNTEGRKEQTPATGQWTADLSYRVLRKALPVKHEARHLTQAAMDHVYDDIQEELFKRHLRALRLQYLLTLDEPAEEPQP